MRESTSGILERMRKDTELSESRSLPNFGDTYPTPKENLPAQIQYASGLEYKGTKNLFPIDPASPYCIYIGRGTPTRDILEELKSEGFSEVFIYITDFNEVSRRCAVIKPGKKGEAILKTFNPTNPIYIYSGSESYSFREGDRVLKDGDRVQLTSSSSSPQFIFNNAPFDSIESQLEENRLPKPEFQLHEGQQEFIKVRNRSVAEQMDRDPFAGYLPILQVFNNPEINDLNALLKGDINSAIQHYFTDLDKSSYLFYPQEFINKRSQALFRSFESRGIPTLASTDFVKIYDTVHQPLHFKYADHVNVEIVYCGNNGLNEFKVLRNNSRVPLTLLNKIFDDSGESKSSDWEHVTLESGQVCVISNECIIELGGGALARFSQNTSRKYSSVLSQQIIDRTNRLPKEIARLLKDVPTNPRTDEQPETNVNVSASFINNNPEDIEEQEKESSARDENPRTVYQAVFACDIEGAKAFCLAHKGSPSLIREIFSAINQLFIAAQNSSNDFIAQIIEANAQGYFSLSESLSPICEGDGALSSKNLILNPENYNNNLSLENTTVIFRILSKLLTSPFLGDTAIDYGVRKLDPDELKALRKIHPDFHKFVDKYTNLINVLRACYKEITSATPDSATIQRIRYGANAGNVLGEGLSISNSKYDYQTDPRVALVDYRRELLNPRLKVVAEGAQSSVKPFEDFNYGLNSELFFLLTGMAMELANLKDKDARAMQILEKINNFTFNPHLCSIKYNVDVQIGKRKTKEKMNVVMVNLRAFNDFVKEIEELLEIK